MESHDERHLKQFMLSDEDIDEIQKILKYEFNDKELLKQSFCHVSCGNVNYERLEFLGDKILGMIISHYMLLEFPNSPPGELTQKTSNIVCNENLSKIIDSLNLDKYIQYGSSISNASSATPASIKADVFEATTAAIFLDKGIFAANDFIYRIWNIEWLEMAQNVISNPKSTLQEWCMKRKIELPRYCTKQSGPSHAPDFMTSVEVTDYPKVKARGLSKRLSEIRAATKLIELIGINK